MWSKRDFDGTTVGLAYVESVCFSQYRYNINENFTNNAESTRVLLAHEMGHNFGAVHDDSGAPYIMAPSVNPNNVNFSSATISAVQNYMTSQSCVANCPMEQLPVCGGWFYDTGGADEAYGNNQDIITTICPEYEGHSGDILFNFFKTESGDVLTCYNGDNTSAPIIWSHSGLMLPTVNLVIGFNPIGCLTFRFTSNSSGTNQGWAASTSCYEVSSCPRPIELSQLPINSENVQVDWTETGFATNWEIELGDLGFTPTGIPTHTTAIKPYTLTNLNSGQQYSLYIRSICTQEESEWIGQYIITTPPSLCLGSIQTGSNAIPNDGSIVTNSNIVAGNYSRFTDITSEDLYTFESSINSDWLIITNESNTLLAQGNSPLNWTVTMDGNIRVHIFVNIFCDIKRFVEEYFYSLCFMLTSSTELRDYFRTF